MCLSFRLKFPWPLPDESVLTAVSSHLVEHIPPFMPDPKLLGLIELLQERKLINSEDVADYIGDVTAQPIFMRFMDEVWRVLKPDGQLALALPHGYFTRLFARPDALQPA
jgi:SAM-dependent methyltransferase